MRRALATAVVVALALAGCASPDQEATTASPESSPTSTAPVTPEESAAADPSAEPEPEEPAVDAIPITIRGDSIEPNGRRIEIAAGEPVTLAIDSDRAAELHVHATPEQVVEVEQGRSETALVIDSPGLVDVEEHETGKIVLQLEVR